LQLSSEWFVVPSAVNECEDSDTYKHAVTCVVHMGVKFGQ